MITKCEVCDDKVVLAFDLAGDAIWLELTAAPDGDQVVTAGDAADGPTAASYSAVGDVGPRHRTHRCDAHVQIPVRDGDGIDHTADLEALGVVVAAPLDPAAPLRRVVLPPTLRLDRFDRLWSYLVDQHGRRRATIFVKDELFGYDFQARLTMATPASYAWTLAHDDAPLVLDTVWATPEALTAAATASLEHHTAEAARYGQIADQHAGERLEAEARESRHNHQRDAARFRALLERIAAAAVAR